MQARRGFSLIELTVVILFTLLLLAAILPALAGSGRTARTVKDATQIKLIHTGMLASAAHRGGSFPLPGDINRTVPLGTGCPIPGGGPMDESRNEHASLHSAMIAGGFISPALLCSPAETSPRVEICRNYDFNSYSPAQDKYWDETNFTVDLSTRSNTSFATMPLDCTARRTAEWRTSNNPWFAVLGSRGVRGGMTSGPGHDQSHTLRFFEPRDAWSGNLCFNDNHIAFVRSPEPSEVRPLASPDGRSPSRPDNLFRNDTHALADDHALRNSDSFLVVQMRAAPNGGYLDENNSALSWD